MVGRLPAFQSVLLAAIEFVLTLWRHELLSRCNAAPPLPLSLLKRLRLLKIRITPTAK